MQPEIKEFVIYSSPSFLLFTHTRNRPVFWKWSLRRSVPLHYINSL